MIGRPVIAGHVYSNSSYLEANKTSECTLQRRTITKVQTHPCYCDSDPDARCGPWEDAIPASTAVDLQYDAAVLTVNEPFRFNKFVQPVCLPTLNTTPSNGVLAMVSGYGATSYWWATPESLQYVLVPIVHHDDCVRMLRKRIKVVTKDMLCAGYLDGGKDSCWGDSGGPLVIFKEGGDQAVLVGVVSWGVGCAEPNLPGIYSNVANFVDWIHEAMSTPFDIDMEDGNVTSSNMSKHGRKTLPLRSQQSDFVDFNNQRCYDYLFNRSLINATLPPPTTPPPPTAPPPPPPPSEEDCRLASPSAPNPFPGQCGRYNVSRAEESKQSRIVNGKASSRGKIPWQAHLPYPGCGAVIIDETHVLTAAHCILGVNSMIGMPVVAGNVYANSSWQFLQFDDDTRPECTTQKRAIRYVQPHPCYCDYWADCGSWSWGELPFPASIATDYQYDAAVITVDEPFRFNEFVQPACLPSTNAEPLNGTWGMTSGFGRFDDEIWDSKPEGLQYAWKPIASRETCTKHVADMGYVVSNDMLCTGFPNDTINPCHGDSGGPMVVFEPTEGDAGRDKKRAVLVGIVSWGPRGVCQEYAIYSNVAYFVDWIHAAMRDPLSMQTQDGNVTENYRYHKKTRQLEEKKSSELTTMMPQRQPLTPPLRQPKFGYVEFDNRGCYNYLLNRSLINATTAMETTTTTTKPETTTTPQTTTTTKTTATTTETTTAMAWNISFVCTELLDQIPESLIPVFCSAPITVKLTWINIFALVLSSLFGFL